MSTVGRSGAGSVDSCQRLADQKARAARRRSMMSTLEHRGMCSLRHGHSGPGRLRFRFISARRRLPSSRRRREPRVGRVERRTTAGATASRSSVARRSRAATRFRRCDRCSAAVIINTDPESLGASRSSARPRCTSSSAVVVPRSKLSCTRESAVLTPWPPGPEAWENCSNNSSAGRVRPRGAPGPEGMCRSSTRSVCRTPDVDAENNAKTCRLPPADTRDPVAKRRSECIVTPSTIHTRSKPRERPQ